MKIVQKLKKFLTPSKKPSAQELVDHLIDEVIFIDENTTKIVISKNLVIENDGTTISINKGYSINIAKEIHLNPKFDDNGEIIKELPNAKTSDIDSGSCEDHGDSCSSCQ